MEITPLIVDILKLGLIGLVFLLMFLGFRLLNNEQKKKEPNKDLLKRASLFVWQSIIVAVLVGAVEIGHRIFEHRQIESCLDAIESLNTVSQHPDQTLETLRAAIRNTWTECKPLGELKDEN